MSLAELNKPESATPSGCLEQKIDRLNKLNEMTLSILERFEKINDRHFGALPKEAGQGLNKNEPHSTLDHIEFVINSIDDSLSRIHGELGRYSEM